jgi:4-amino-4-deoxy-L-arabinose transferase-like glycosyltransferase
MVKPAWGIPLAVLVVAPWLVVLALGGEPGFVVNAVRQDVLPKLIGGQEGHGAAPGSYLVVTALTAWPWSLLIPAALVGAWPTRATPAVRFCYAWLVPAWLVFEAVPTKLPHYILPLMPAAALLLGAVVQDGRRWRGVMTRPTGRGWRVIFALISLGLGVGITWTVRTYGYSPITAAVVAAAVAALGAGLSLAAGRLAAAATTALAAVIAAVFCTAMVGGVLPRLDNLWISTRLAAEVARHAPTSQVVLVGFHEPSAVFLLGTETLLTAPNAAADVLLAKPNALAVVDGLDVQAVTQAVEDGGKQVTQVGKIDGYNYARGRWIALVLLTAQ